jgi:transcriptional regulator with XRE-family HTH domain
MDDLISRQAAINVVEKWFGKIGLNPDICIDGLISLPSAQPEQRWIPCSERLPEDIRPVIVTWKNTDPKSYYQYIVGKHFMGTACYKNGKWYWYSSTTEDMLAEYGRYDSEEFDEAIECIAWMPLPDPYKTDIRINVSKWEDKEPTETVKEEYNMANNIIGERIAGLLREQGKTQKELAEQVGTTEVSISRYIKGDRVPKGPILANIAKALHTTTDYLVGNEKDSNDPELEYNYTQRAIARNANRWSKKQKLDLVKTLFENED